MSQFIVSIEKSKFEISFEIFLLTKLCSVVKYSSQDFNMKLIKPKFDMFSVNFSTFRFAPAHFMGGTFCSCHRLKKRNFEKWFGLLRVVPICDICKKDFFDAYLEKQRKKCFVSAIITKQFINLWSTAATPPKK